jgi:hypothetical protein
MPERPRYPPLVRSALTWSIVALGIVAGASSLSRPKNRPATSPSDRFSSERAMAHVSELTREPRPTGSPANARARAYIIAQLEELELSPEVQETSPPHRARDHSRDRSRSDLRDSGNRPVSRNPGDS